VFDSIDSIDARCNHDILTRIFENIDYPVLIFILFIYLTTMSIVHMTYRRVHKTNSEEYTGMYMEVAVA